MKYFDFEKTASEAGISREKLSELKKKIRQEFPKDEMMYELHVLRACMAIRDRYITLDDALRAEPASVKS